MTAAEANKLIGLDATWIAENRLRFRVIITDVRTAYGRIDFLVSPHSGSGREWVSAKTITDIPPSALT